MNNCQSCLMLKEVRKLKVEQIQFVDSEDTPAYCRACYQQERAENNRLKEAGRALYYAGVWHCDRPVSEAKLWEDLRDAMGLSKGTSPEALKGKG